jgi:hypothetical protein
MIKELTILANRLDGKGFTKEADLLDDIIFKLANDASGNTTLSPIRDQQGSIAGEFDFSGRREPEIRENVRISPSKVPQHKGFSWPWEVWNKKTEKEKEDFYDTLNLLSWCPFLSIGTDSLNFVLHLLDRQWGKAALSFIFIILSFYVPARFASKVAAATGRIVLTRAAKVDLALNIAKEAIDRAAVAFGSTDSFKDFSSHLIAQKNNLQKQIEERMDEIEGQAMQQSFYGYMHQG